MTALKRASVSLGQKIAMMDVSTRLQLALLVSFTLHSIFLLGVNFKFPDSTKRVRDGLPLEVVLVNSRTVSKPLHPDVLAQYNLDGGGNTESERRAKSPLPVRKKNEHPSDQLVRAQRRVAKLEEKARKLAAQVSEKKIEQQESPPQTEKPKVKTPDAMDLVQSGLEEARLEAQIAREQEEYQHRPRRMFIGARAKEYAFTRYVDDWRIKVERIGNLNYPDAARRQKIYGSLVLTVSIRADGSVEYVEINRSSGEKILDAAAIRIVQLSSPFAPFSEEMRKKVDILSITRTWTFTRSDQLSGEE
ncbi:MAG TPA: energy transducer TonB [Burkholderiales bacterium]|nr:energy transducer TonB [Burkholderiales bacterium]